MNDNTTSVQPGPLYTCFTCGAPALIGRSFADGARAFLSAGYSACALDEWGAHIWYLEKHCKCQPERVVRLGDAISPLHGTARDGVLCADDIPQIRAALAAIAAAVPEEQRTHDPVTKIVCRLAAGQMSPDTAIAELRALLGERVRA